MMIDIKYNNLCVIMEYTKVYFNLFLFFSTQDCCVSACLGVLDLSKHWIYWSDRNLVWSETLKGMMQHWVGLCSPQNKWLVSPPSLFGTVWGSMRKFELEMWVMGTLRAITELCLALDWGKWPGSDMWVVAQTFVMKMDGHGLQITHLTTGMSFALPLSESGTPSSFSVP